jgi:hypothetical protein
MIETPRNCSTDQTVEGFQQSDGLVLLFVRMCHRNFLGARVRIRKLDLREPEIASRDLSVEPKL